MRCFQVSDLASAHLAVLEALAAPAHRLEWHRGYEEAGTCLSRWDLLLALRRVREALDDCEAAATPEQAGAERQALAARTVQDHTGGWLQVECPLPVDVRMGSGCLVC